MENGGISSTGTNEVTSTQTFDNAVQQLYYPPVYNNTTNTYGSSNVPVYERQPPSQMHNAGDLMYTPQPPYAAAGTSTTMTSAANLHPTQPPILHPNPSSFSGYVASLPAPPPYAPQHPNQLYSSSDQSRAGSLPLSSQTLDQFLATPQSHLLQLRGTNPPNQPPQTNNFHTYGMPDRPQRFTTFPNLPFSTGPGVKPSTVGQILEEDSSSAFREASSHINRKKRKACGRCGPCQRKDNCGTCMNCVNRAKGKQICIFRKCEELKKKPGGENYAPSTTPDHQVESAAARQEKRKELEQFFSERKRSRTEDSVGSLTQGNSPLQSFSGFTSTNLNFGQQPGLVAASVPTPQSYTGQVPPHGTYQQLLQQTHSPRTSFPNTPGTTQPEGSNGGSTHTTDIISEALREIENNNTESTDLTAVLAQGVPSSNTTKNGTINPNFTQPQQHQNYPAWSHSTESIPPQDSSLRSQLQLQGNVRLPGQPPPLPPGPGPGQQPQLPTANPQFQPTNTQGAPASQALPDQLLSNLTRFNEFGAFQRTVSSPNQSNVNKRPSGVHRPNYEDTPGSTQSQVYTINVTGNTVTPQPAGVISAAAPISSQQTIINQTSSTSTPGNMYHNMGSLAYGSPHPSEGSMQNVEAQNPVISPRSHHPYRSPGNPNQQRPPVQNYQAVMPHSRFPNSPNVSYQHSPQYVMQSRQMHGFHSNMPQQSPDYVQRKQSAEQHSFSNHTTSSGTVVGNPNRTPNPTTGQGYYSPQMAQRQWDGASYNQSVQQSSPGVTATGNPLMVKQEIFSPKPSHSALHSPVSSFSQESNEQSHVISQMPELAPSPISQNAGLDPGLQVKAERLDAPQQFTTAIPADNIQRQNIDISRQTVHLNMSIPPNQNNTTYPPPGGQNFLGNISGAVRHPYQQNPGVISTTNGILYNQHGRGARPGQNHFHPHQTPPVSGVYLPAQNLGGAMAIPSTSNQSGANFWQAGQQPDSSAPALPPSVTSQSETNLTISPGESGYDSAEIVHGAEDAASQHTLSRDNTPQGHSVDTNEKNSVSEDLQHAESPNNANDVVSKNLYRAPVGTMASSVIVNSTAAYPSHLKSGLPSAGACTTMNNRQSVIAATMNCVHSQNVNSRRSLSCDSAATCAQTEEKQPVRLRRYSNQELSTNKDGMITHPRLPTSLSENDMNSLAADRFRRDSQRMQLLNKGIKDKSNQMTPSASSDGSQKNYTIPKPDVKPFTFHKNFDTIGQRRIVPFDTPPVTPRSVDFVTRRPSTDTASDSGIPVHKIANLLPTPPHTTETPVGKYPMNEYPSVPHEGYDIKMADMNTASHRGFKVQNNESSPCKTEFAACNCIEGTDGRNGEAPYYTHLGAAESILGIRKLFEKRTRYSGSAIRIEKVIYTGKEGKTSTGCPMAKWIIRRSSEEEKVLIVCRQRPGHRCATAVIVVIILLWDGVARPLADFAYGNFTNYVPKHGEPTERRCATNDERTCACQGFDDGTCGASFSFGCSWSMYYNGCKFARSNVPNKYKLAGTKDPEAEKFVGMLCEKLATVMSPLYEMAAPDAFHNQVEREEQAPECRLGEARNAKCRPFSGVTSCLDFCAHSHKDQHNMDNGSTVVVTFTKPELRTIGGKPGDEQLHVLPLCKLDISNEQGTFQGVAEKIQSGAIEILQRFRHEARLRKEPKLSKKQKSRAKKKSDANESPLNKRRGRPPKRCRSFENLLENGGIKNSRPTGSTEGFRQNDFSQTQFHTPPRSRRIISAPHGAHPFSPQFQPSPSGPLSPTRWPYRRPVPPYGAEPTMTPTQMNSSPQLENCQPPTPGQSTILDDNLPSIGNFFHRGAGPDNAPDENAPATGQQTPSQSDPKFRASSEEQTMQPYLGTPVPVDNIPPTPLPSIKDVVTHPFHQNFALVTPNPHTPQPNATPTGTLTPVSDSAPGTPQHYDSSISLKAYAAQNDPNIPHNAPNIRHNVPIASQNAPNSSHNTLIAPRDVPNIHHNMPNLHHNVQNVRNISQNVPNGPNMHGSMHEGFQQATHTSYQEGESVVYSDSEENFLDSEIGGVAVAPGHGSVLIECAKKELHATTALHRPNRFYPSRISLVFYQHKSMNTRNHGAAEYEAKEEERRKQREEKKQEEMLKARENAAAANTINSQLLLPEMAQPLIIDQLTSGQYPISVSSNPIWNPALLAHNGNNMMLAAQQSQQYNMQRAHQILSPNRPDPSNHHGIQSQSPMQISTSPLHRKSELHGGNTADASQRQVIMRQYASMQHNLQSPGINMGPQTARTPQPLEQELPPQPHQGQNWPRGVFPYNSFSPQHRQIYIQQPSNQVRQSFTFPMQQQNSSPSPNAVHGQMQTGAPHIMQGNIAHTNRIRQTSHAQNMHMSQMNASPMHVPQLRQHMYRLPSMPSQSYTMAPHIQSLYASSAPRGSMDFSQSNPSYPILSNIPTSHSPSQGYTSTNQGYPMPGAMYGVPTTVYNPSVKQ